jgi:outer membrane protein OmpA-like peptidoglycan-associated protein
MSKVSEVAAYINQNPSLQVGIDGSTAASGTEPRNENLNGRRVETVRAALIAAGVPSYRISTGAFGDTGLTQDRRVEVLISSVN